MFPNRKFSSIVYKLMIPPAFLFFILLSVSCHNTTAENKNVPTTADKEAISTMLDNFNKAAAEAEFNQYFSYFTNDATFIGTDATENWSKESFKVWAKPYFDNKETWKFYAVDRNIYLSKDCNLAWFDELLNTHMKLSRGSGVVVKENGEWKIQQYVLSITVPNENIDSVIKIKAPAEEEVLSRLSKK